MTTTPSERTGRRTIATTTMRALLAAGGPAPTDADEKAVDETPLETEPVELTKPAVPHVDDVVEPVVEEPAVEEPAEKPAKNAAKNAAKKPTNRPDKASAAAVAAAKRDVRPGVALVMVAAGVAVAALVFAGVAGYVWWRAGHDGDRTQALARDAVMQDARLAAATLNSSNYTNPKAGVDNWLAASTGALRDEFTNNRATAEKAIAASKTVSTATVLDAAVISLDTDKGRATVIASVNSKRTPDKKAAFTIRNRYQLALSLVGGRWKVSAITIVAVQPS